LIALLCGCVLIGGIAWPICVGMISKLSPKNMEGKVFGFSQSMQSLAMIVSPILGGLVAKIYQPFPLILAGIAGFIAVLVNFLKKNN